MPESRDVAVLVGSLRRASFTRRIAVALGRVAPPTLKLEIVEIGDLPLYNQDLETDSPPAPWTRLRDRIRAADAVLFATPEYNRSVPAVLKNAIDVGSRPPVKSAWRGKPAAVVSVSPGALAAFGANHHLRQSLVALDMPTVQQPEVYLGGVAELVDEHGNFTNETTKQFLTKFMNTFAQWIEVLRCRP